MKNILLFFLIIFCNSVQSQFAPAAGELGTTAIHKDSSIFVNWGHEVYEFNRGVEDISVTNSPQVTFGDSTEALGVAEGNSIDVVSLGDGGQITLALEYPIKNDVGPDFAVFENSFSNTFLELALVEVSTDGEHFVQFPSQSLTSSANQVNSFGTLDPTLIHNLAGKYKQGYGTPFDLEDLTDSLQVNIDSINYIKIIDVVGTINSNYGSYDSNGNLINDPYPSPFASGGFDLDALGIINENNIYASLSSESQPLIKVYPNPASNLIKLDIDNYELSVYNMAGQKVATAKNSNSINCAHWPNGIYLISVQANARLYQQKIMVKH